MFGTCQFNSKIIRLCKRFVDQCDMCRKMFVRDSPAPTVGQKLVGGDCQVRLHILEIFHMLILFVLQATKSNGRNCRGKLRDFVLDWEAELPQEVCVLMPRFFSCILLLPGSFHVFNFSQDLDMSDTHSMQADLSIVLGSTLQVKTSRNKLIVIFPFPQIIPAGNMPTYGKKYQKNGRLVICNLQPTKQVKLPSVMYHHASPHFLMARTRRRTCASTPMSTM